MEKQSEYDVCVPELTLLFIKLTLGEQKAFLWLISCDILDEQKKNTEKINFQTNHVSEFQKSSMFSGQNNPQNLSLQ